MFVIGFTACDVIRRLKNINEVGKYCTIKKLNLFFTNDNLGSLRIAKSVTLVS